MKLETRHCTLCGAKAGKSERYPANFTEEDLNAAIFSARRMPDRRHFRLVECEECGIVFSDPACDPGTLATLYQHSAVTYDAQEEEIYQSYAPVLARALPVLQRRGTFLEIGGGRGFMLRWGAEQGFDEQIEIEPSADAERKFSPPSMQARFIRGIFSRGLLPEGSVSLACFFQMLDHVPDPRVFLEAVRETLEPGGAAVCVTHDTSAVSARLLGERTPIYDIEHTYLFNPDNMARLFRRAGFEVVETFPIANRYALRHWAHLAPVPRRVRKVVLSVLEHVKLAGLPVPLRAGNFAIVARRPNPN